MASVTVSREDLFPVGTTVAAYPAAGLALGQTPSSGAPAGSAAATEDVDTDGTLTFTGLLVNREYILYAATPDRYLRVTTFLPASGLPTGGSEGDVLTKASDDDGDVEWAAP